MLNELVHKQPLYHHTSIGGSGPKLSGVDYLVDIKTAHGEYKKPIHVNWLKTVSFEGNIGDHEANEIILATLVELTDQAGGYFAISEAARELLDNTFSTTSDTNAQLPIELQVPHIHPYPYHRTYFDRDYRT